MAVFYHCWWRRDAARSIMQEQMRTLSQCGLESAAAEIHIGFQGSPEGLAEVKHQVAPRSAAVHPVPEQLGETPTLKLVHAWAREHPDALVCYFHAKGASHGDSTHIWRHCLEKSVLWGWKDCVVALQRVESAGAHWIVNRHGQWFWAGNFWWCTAAYLASLPPPAETSRWDPEIWVSNVTRMPTVKELAGHAFGQCAL